MNEIRRGLRTAIVLGVMLTAPAAASDAPGQPARAVVRHVIVVSIDGLRPDAIPRWAPVLEALKGTGAWAGTAETVTPSRTLPSHTSMVTGVLPERHGITWNGDETGLHGPVAVPTMFDLATAHGLRSVAFFSKAKLRHLQRPGALEHAQAPRGATILPATETVEDAVRYMLLARPNLVFIHITEPDIAGHAFGWMGHAYAMAVRHSDAAVGRLLAAAERAYGADGFTMIITADHGGRGRDHGTSHPEDMLIPWIVTGAGVRPGPIPGLVRTMDTAATALWLLGITPPDSWDGVPVLSAFTAPGVAAPQSHSPQGTRKGWEAKHEDPGEHGPSHRRRGSAQGAGG
jgi:predicted AlkP superfamily pyrophosphatase or phosphodiesterase